MITLRSLLINGGSRPIYIGAKRYSSPSPAVAAAESSSELNEWEMAKPFNSIPRPSKIEFLCGHLPGGRFHRKSMNEVNRQMRKDYGDIFIIPGMFGKNGVVFTYNPEDFQKIYHTEGKYPIRPPLEVLGHYREVYRAEVFKGALGLVVDQGAEWWKFRSIVNPVLMNPKTFKLYTPKMSKIAEQFIERIRKIRDPNTKEVPDNFMDEIDHLSMETLGVVALDTHFGLIDQSTTNKEAKKLMNSIHDFFELLLELHFKPSIWKYVATPLYKKFVANMDIFTDLSIHYVEEAEQRLKAEKEKGIMKPESEQSVLERLIKTDITVAKVMAIDTILGGLDTFSAGFASCLIQIATNPEKQHKLRKEILEILPQKDTPLTANKMNNLPYLRACIKESLRLNPVNPNNFRATGQNVVLSGYQVPKGVNVTMPNEELLVDEKYYLRPKEFLPERWLRSNSNKADEGCPLKKNFPFVYLPFGFGPRICIGKRIADLELEINLAKLVRNFEIGFDYPTDGLFKPQSILNIPAKPLKLKFIDLKE